LRVKVGGAGIERCMAEELREHGIRVSTVVPREASRRSLRGVGRNPTKSAETRRRSARGGNDRDARGHRASSAKSM